MVNEYNCGSEWRKREFHVHTPASILNHQYGDNWDKFVKTLFTAAIEKNIDCIGRTDFFQIDVYKIPAPVLG